MPDKYSRNIDASASSSLVYLTYTVWIRRKAIFLLTVGLMVIVLAICLLSTPLYRAQATAYPAASATPPGGSLSAIAANLTGGAGLSNGLLDMTPPIQKTLALLQSRALILQYLYANREVQGLFPERWDTENHRWNSPSILERFGAWLTGKPLHNDPTADEIFDRFNNICTVAMDQDTGVITVSVEWSDPQLAAKWANGLIKAADNTLRNEARTDTQKSVTYLQEEAAQASLSDLRDAIYSVAAREITKGMTASVANHFAIQIIDPAVPPARKSWPRSAFLLALALLAGLFFGSLGAIAAAYLQELRETAHHLGLAVSFTAARRLHDGDVRKGVTTEEPDRGDLG